MIKSWLDFFLPDDEYKRQRIVCFFAESTVILILSFVILFSINRLSNWNLDVEIALGLGIAIPLLYLSVRYILSGMEYTDVATVKRFKKQRKAFFVKTISFVVIFLILYILFTGIPKVKDQWVDIVGLLVSVGFIMFISDYISLKRSYKKNRELVDDK